MNAAAVAKWASEIVAGERRSLAKAITLIESDLVAERKTATLLLQALAPKTGKSMRIAVSGVPGVGKSTFLEAWGQTLLEANLKLAILAIDPSSPISGGSILGDRTRMEELSRNPNVFIRPTPSRGTTGGVSRHTREAILACEAAGFDVVLVETVGVGQSEAVAASMVDLFMVLQLPHAGDDLQAIKRGILELADLIVVTKADGSTKDAAARAKNELSSAMTMTRGAHDWKIPVLACSSLDRTGLAEIWAETKAFFAHQKRSGAFTSRRASQALAWFREELGVELRERLLASDQRRKSIEEAERRVASGATPASSAVSELLDKIFPL